MYLCLGGFVHVPTKACVVLAQGRHVDMAVFLSSGMVVAHLCQSVFVTCKRQRVLLMTAVRVMRDLSCSL